LTPDGKSVVRVIPEPSLEDVKCLSSALNSNSCSDVEKTFADHFKSKHCREFHDVIDRLSENSNHKLIYVNTLVKKYRKVRDLLSNKKVKIKKSVQYYIGEFCYPIGVSFWYYFSIYLPAVVHRIQSLFLADEARSFFNRKNSLSSKFQHPSISNILSAITPNLALEKINSERHYLFLQFIYFIDII
jgi:hypothetical protein